jgi:hypothetical protein
MIFALAHSLVLGVVAWFLFDLAGSYSRRKLFYWAAVFLSFALSAAVMFLALRQIIGPDLITAVQESTTLGDIRQLYGKSTHAGENFSWLMGLFTREGADRIYGVIAFNLVLTCVVSIVLFYVAYAVSGSLPWALMLGCANALSFPNRLSALSESPAAIVAAYFWLGVFLFFIINRELAAAGRFSKTGNSRLWAALSALVCDTFLVMNTRIEFILVAMAAILAVAARMLFSEVRLAHLQAAAFEKIRALLKRIGSFSWLAVFLLLVILLIPQLVLYKACGRIGGAHIRSICSAVNAFDATFLNAPFFLSTLLPLGMVLLFVLGVVYTLRQCLVFALLPVSFLLLFRVYYDTSHGVFYEMLRYMLNLMPLVMFFALLGYKEIERFFQKKGLQELWQKPVFILFGLFMLASAFSGYHTLLGRDEIDITGWKDITLDRNVQREVRYLAELTGRYKKALFISQVTQDDYGKNRGNAFKYVVFGSALPSPLEVASASGLSNFMSESSRKGRQVLLYRGLDCNLDHGPDCFDGIEKGQLLEERRFADRPYNDKDEFGGHQPEVRLQVYRVILENGVVN